MTTEQSTLQNLERILSNNKKADKGARYVALDVVRKELKRISPPVLKRKISKKQIIETYGTGPVALKAVNNGKSYVCRITQPVYATILGFLRNNQYINAIKEMRAATNCGLLHAKMVIDFDPSCKWAYKPHKNDF